MLYLAKLFSTYCVLIFDSKISSQLIKLNKLKIRKLIAVTPESRFPPSVIILNCAAFSNNSPIHRYWSYINAASEEKKDFWLYLWILRLGFVFAFQNTVWTIVRIIEALVPDTPKTVKERGNCSIIKTI